MVKMNPLSLAFLHEEVRIFEDAWNMVLELDNFELQPLRPMIAVQISSNLIHRLPAFHCTHDPLTTELNRIILKRYEFIKQHMICQSSISEEIVRLADSEAIVVMLIDGLSYADIKKYAPERLCNVKPILVDGVSSTEQGMMRIISSPFLAQRLIESGFERVLGFTYWERHGEPLTDRLFMGFGERVHKVKSFSEILEVLDRENLFGTFIQIIRVGLDTFAHRNRDMPNIRALVSDILSDFDRLVILFKDKGISAWLHLISDHGILWVHEHDLQLYESKSNVYPRHYDQPLDSEHTLITEFEGRKFAILEYPYLRRKLHANEWGVHGGLSFEESVVPWLSIHVGKGKEWSYEQRCFGCL